MTREIRVRMLENDRTAIDMAQAVGISESTWHYRMRHPESWRLGELRVVAHELGALVTDLVIR